jgi:hypothetical protein
MITKLTRTVAAGLLCRHGALPVVAQSGKPIKRLVPVPMTTAMVDGGRPRSASATSSATK